MGGWFAKFCCEQVSPAMVPSSVDVLRHLLGFALQIFFLG